MLQAFAPLTIEAAAAANLAEATRVTPTQVQAVQDHTAAFWRREIVPALTEYVRIPNVSRDYNPAWETDGHMDRAERLATTWVARQQIRGAELHVSRLPGLTPVIVVQVPGNRDGNVLMYGHYDKQPGMDDKWRPGLGPWTPVIQGNRLYGRGSSDDGYALHSSVAALKALQDLGIPHPRTTILIEFAEESGSIGLMQHLHEPQVSAMVGTPDLVICLDSEVKSYDAIGLSTSLRGLIGGTLSVSTLTEAIHSGRGGSVVIDPFLFALSLLGRFGDILGTQRVTAPELQVEIPERRRVEAAILARLLGARIVENFPVLPGAGLLVNDPVGVILEGTWSPSLTVIGQEGLPSLGNAGNVIQAGAQVAFSIRIPPTLDPRAASEFIRRTLMTADPRYPGVRVEVSDLEPHAGWHSPILPDELVNLVMAASRAFYGNPSVATGVGGSIPFMAMLGERFPLAHFIITGVLGPESNAHGPNEFLHLDYAQRLTAAVALIMAGMR